MPEESYTPHLDAIREVLPDYETDLSAVGTARRAVDPDPRPWHEVHGLTTAQVAEALTAGEDPA